MPSFTLELRCSDKNGVMLAYPTEQDLREGLAAISGMVNKRGWNYALWTCHKALRPKPKKQKK